MRRPAKCAVLLCLALFALACHAAEPPAASLELQVKAAFVYNFAKFVEWPAAGTSGVDPLTFCVIGAEPLYQLLEQSLHGKTIAGRPVAARQTDRGPGDPACNVVFVGGDREHPAETAAAAAASGALTVGDSSDFTERGGMIQLIKVENKFRFAINVEAVNRAGLHISAKLLQLSGKAPTAPAGRSNP